MTPEISDAELAKLEAAWLDTVDAPMGVRSVAARALVVSMVPNLIAALRFARSAAILAARSSPEDIRKAGWLLVRHDDFASGSLHKTMWVFVPVEPSDHRWIEGTGPTDADALDQIRRQLNLPIPSGAASRNPIDVFRRDLLSVFSRIESRAPYEGVTRTELTALSGSMKDVLLGLGLVWDDTTKDYTFDPLPIPGEKT